MTKRIYLIFYLGFFVASVVAHACADQVFNVAVRGRAVSGVTIAASDEIDGNDCEKTKLNDSNVYVCRVSLSSGDDNVKDYKIRPQSDDLNFPYPLMLRVFANNKSPVKLNIDLSDPVFGHDFSPSRKYYSQWLDGNSKMPDDSLNFYLVTRNYYGALSEGLDEATAWVLHEWLRRGTYLTEHIPYIAVDAGVLGEIRKLQSSLSGPQLEVFNKYGPKLTSPDGPTDFQRMEVANWSLYKVLNETRVAPSGPFPSSLCNLFEFFQAQWKTADSAQSVIKSAWHVDADTLMQDGTKTYLVRCSAK